MRFYRVAHVDPDWESSALGPADNGHPLYVHRPGQGAGRFDLPEFYLGLYVARQQAAAIGELLGHLSQWPESEITRTREIERTVLVRSLIALDVEREFIDLDNASALDAMGWRPSDIVNRDRTKTQELAYEQWLQQDSHGKGGFSWWSYWRPSWTVAMAWADPDNPTYPDITIDDVEPLHKEHPAVLNAARSLQRPIT